jgi:hypothetical protein
MHMHARTHTHWITVSMHLIYSLSRQNFIQNLNTHLHIYFILLHLTLNYFNITVTWSKSGQCSQHSDQTMGYTNEKLWFSSQKRKKISLFSCTPDKFCNSPGCYKLFSWGLSNQGTMLITHPHLLPSSRNVYSYTSTPTHAFNTCSGTTISSL